MKKIISNIKDLKKEEKIIFFLIFTTIVNIFMSFLKIMISLILPSFWVFLNGIFMITLSISRVFSIKDYNKTRSLEDKYEILKIEYNNYMSNGILLIVLGIMYFFVNVYIYYKGTNTNMHPYLTYLVALVAFYSITSAIYGMIKYKRNINPILKAVKLTNFANALTSIMLTQIVLLDTCAVTSMYNSNLINGITGMCVGIIIILIGLYMIVGISKINKID